MNLVKVSFVVPYKNRLHNISMLFTALAHQTMPKNEFEVVVGAMEYCSAYAELCNRFKDQLNIVTVCTSKPWQVALARNIAVRQASGTIVVFLDADMILSPKFLETLYYRHYAYRPQLCIIGQMINYDNNATDVTAPATRPYSDYAELLRSLDHEPQCLDERFKVRHDIPWSFAWTALIAIPRQLLLQHNLLFDEHFFGYGVEDLEWGYRISQAGIPIALKEDVFGIHLPHVRNVGDNRDTERTNYRYFLRKFPTLDVELTCAFGDFQGNSRLAEVRRETTALSGHRDVQFCVVKGSIKGSPALIVGLLQHADGKLVDDTALARLDHVEATLPLLGLALPYNDHTFAECLVSASILRLSQPYREMVLTECSRVAAIRSDI